MNNIFNRFKFKKLLKSCLVSSFLGTATYLSFTGSLAYANQIIPMKQKNVISSVIILSDHQSKIAPITPSTASDKSSNNITSYKLTLKAENKTIGLLPIVPRGSQEYISSKEFNYIWNLKVNNVKQSPPDAIIHYFLKGRPYHEVVKVISLQLITVKEEDEKDVKNEKNKKNKTQKELVMELQPVSGNSFNFTSGKATNISPMSLFIDNFSCGGVGTAGCILP